MSCEGTKATHPTVPPEYAQKLGTHVRFFAILTIF
jgi:hypothetical protein